MLNINKNSPSVATLPVFNGVRVLKILHIIIEEKKDSYNCIMEDGTIKAVPTESFKVKKEEA